MPPPPQHAPFNDASGAYVLMPVPVAALRAHSSMGHQEAIGGGGSSGSGEFQPMHMYAPPAGMMPVHVPGGYACAPAPMQQQQLLLSARGRGHRGTGARK